MKAQFVIAFLLGLTLSAIVTQEEKNEIERDFALLSTDEHKSWCSIQAYWKNKWCNSKAWFGTIGNKTLSNLRSQACNYTYTYDLSLCPSRMLEIGLEENERHEFNFGQSMCKYKSNAKFYYCKLKAMFIKDPVAKSNANNECQNKNNEEIAKCTAPASRLLGLPTDEDMTEEAKHKSWCSFKAWSKKAWCKTKGFSTDSAKKALNYANCDAQYNAALALCPARMLNKAADRQLSGKSNHKSWCTFKAWSRKSWCKTKGFSLDSVKKAANYAQCDIAYNLDVAACAQNRLLKQLEEGIKSGNAHESWCNFKNRLSWIGCKTKAGIKFNDPNKKANLAACDAKYNAAEAACKNRLLEAESSK